MQAHLNRSIIIIVPKKPFYDWVNYLDPEHPIHAIEDNDSFMLPDNCTIAQARSFIKKYYSDIFEDRLHGMWTDENDWPQKRTYKVFNEWFDWHFSTVVIDTVVDEPIGVEVF